jgi:hypothetical protein
VKATTNAFECEVTVSKSLKVKKFILVLRIYYASAKSNTAGREETLLAGYFERIIFTTLYLGAIDDTIH